jgi:TolB-like protein/tRNA A-37 threonylcarbamoyl transferase component Bud32
MTAPARACPACHTPLPDEAQFCLQCGTATPTEPGVPSRTTATEAVEVTKVRQALADRYRVERVLGEGGMATVYLAEDLKHRRKVAVKVMRPELAATLGADRFLREIEIAAQLSHPHILPVHDSGETGGILYYVMPYVDGESLRERVQRDGQLPVDEALQLAREVAEALGHAHKRGIIHRDIKPANVMLGEGHALVADFGIARATDGGQALTQTGLAVGTPQYMSPEQATGERDIDARADVYAIGAVLYEMLAGQPPYTGATPQAVLAKSLTEEIAPLSLARPGVPAAVAAVVAKATARKPGDRYASAVELEQALAEARDAVRSGAIPVAAGATSAGTAWGAFGLAAVVSLAVIYGLVSRWGLASWTLGLAGGLLVIGAGVLLATGQFEGKRRAGAAVTGVGRWFTWGNAARGGGMAATLWVTVALVLVFRGPGAPGGGHEVKRLAVLPFENLGSTDDAYFADGIADEMRGKLTALPSFQVTARSSSVQYRGTTKSPQEIGRELSVDYLLTATVRWAKTADGSSRVQVVPELIDVRTGAATWQQTFDAELTDVFDVQQTIARQVATALGVALGAGEQEELGARPTSNVAAYDAYLRGEAVFQSTGGEPSALRRAATFYEQAIALDSTFGLAWARMAHVRALLFFLGMPTEDEAAEARRALERAEQLVPRAPETYWARSTVATNVLRDRQLAREAATDGLAAYPSNVDLMRLVAGFEVNEQPEEALAVLERTVELDPRSPTSWTTLAATLVNLHRGPEAMEAAVKGLAIDPSNYRMLQLKMIAQLQQGDLAAVRRTLTTLPRDVDEASLAAYLATYQDLFWVLTDAQQQLVLTLPPSAFDNDRATWAAVRMQTYSLRGDRTRARAWADTARRAYLSDWNAPDDPQFHQLYGVALAYLGRYDEAVREAKLGLAMADSLQSNSGYAVHQLARVYLLADQPSEALDQIERLLGMQYNVTPRWLTVDPAFAPLKGNPRFERLTRGE